MTRLRKRPGCADAANNVDDVPISGATTCGRSRPKASAIRTMKSPIALGFISSSAALGPAEPRRVNRDQMRILGQLRPHLLECKHTFRPRAQQDRVAAGLPALR